MKLTSEHAHARWYLDFNEAGLCCCYLVMHIEKRITSFETILLPSVPYLLTLPSMYEEATIIRSRDCPPGSAFVPKLNLT